MTCSPTNNREAPSFSLILYIFKAVNSFDLHKSNAYILEALDIL
uniref:Uncharacterized protein n=1 Tax=Rhizophora mucronata TaxID=61149 RepID=A0A2P2ISK8_RHIMU